MPSPVFSCMAQVWGVRFPSGPFSSEAARDAFPKPPSSRKATERGEYHPKPAAGPDLPSNDGAYRTARHGSTHRRHYTCRRRKNAARTGGPPAKTAFPRRPLPAQRRRTPGTAPTGRVAAPQRRTRERFPPRASKFSRGGRRLRSNRTESADRRFPSTLCGAFRTGRPRRSLPQRPVQGMPPCGADAPCEKFPTCPGRGGTA